jgi:hypothetical protein
VAGPAASGVSTTGVSASAARSIKDVAVFPEILTFKDAALALLRHKFRSMFYGHLRAQHGQRGSIRAIPTTIAQWTVAIELGMCLWGRSAAPLGQYPLEIAVSRTSGRVTWSRGGNRLPLGDQESIGRRAALIGP